MILIKEFDFDILSFFCMDSIFFEFEKYSLKTINLCPSLDWENIPPKPSTKMNNKKFLFLVLDLANRF